MGNSNNVFDSVCDEIYALLVAKKIYPEMFTKIKKWESPDWIDENNEIGLEVTHAENKHIGYTNYLANTYLGVPKKLIPKDIIREFQGYMEFKNQKLFLISDSKGLVDGNRHVTLLLKCLETKLKKLNESHFYVCKHNYLFEYSTGCLSESDKQEFVCGIRDQSIKYLNIFEKIIISTYDEVLCFDSDGTYTSHTVSLRELTKLTKQYRKAIEWKRGILFSEAQRKINKTRQVNLKF